MIEILFSGISVIKFLTYRPNGFICGGEMEQKKRVYCLYRVSTVGQVEKDDIPMQKQSCREFAERMGWEIV